MDLWTVMGWRRTPGFYSKNFIILLPIRVYSDPYLGQQVTLWPLQFAVRVERDVPTEILAIFHPDANVTG